MLKNIKKFVLVTIVVAWPIVGQASLIGDTVTIGHFYPDSSTICGGCLAPNPVSVVVEAGIGDQVTLGVTGQPYIIDMEAEGFTVSFPGDQGWLNGGAEPFNGIIISDLDWIGSSTGYITGLIFNTIPVGYLTDNVTFTADSVSIRLGVPGTGNNLYFAGESFDITLETAHVPLTSSLALFGLGLVGLGLTRRKKA